MARRAAVDEADKEEESKPKESSSTVAKCRAADLALLKHLGMFSERAGLWRSKGLTSLHY